MSNPNLASSSLSAMPSETPTPTVETKTTTEQQTGNAYHRPVLRDEGSISHLTHGIIDEPESW
ncbi:hypothetical protein GC175_15085 [bacterium]|nr:hypothetical protein [bacterium]